MLWSTPSTTDPHRAQIEIAVPELLSFISPTIWTSLDANLDQFFWAEFLASIIITGCSVFGVVDIIYKNAST